jgi:hypothetical protein
VHDEDLNTFHGECHRNPPGLFDYKSHTYETQDMIKNKEKIGKFPITHYCNWCGEYKYNELLKLGLHLRDLNFLRNLTVISSHLGREINVERVDEALDDLERRQIRTVGEWLSIRNYEPLLIPDFGRNMIYVLDAAIELLHNGRLELD